MSVAFDKSKVRVLVTDDESSIRTVITTYLKEEGWNVESAENGKLGLAAATAAQFHIILSDIQMPEMTGIEFLEAIKKSQPNVEFIIMTSNATLETAMQAIKLGAYDYLTKPFDDLSVVSKKLTQVSEKIFLRQQNTELIRRLKKASFDLKRLFEFAASLMGTLEEDKLRELALAGMPKLFQDENARAAWMEGAEKAWKVLGQTKSEVFSSVDITTDIESAISSTSGLRNPKTMTLVKNESQNIVIVYEDLIPELSALWAHEIRICFASVSQYQNMVQLAHRDGLTKLYNHRYFQDRLRQEISQVKRQQNDLSLIIIDVDNFKHYNDSHGHPEGDKLLKELSALFDQESSRRDSDIVARYGGEEFIFLLPFTDYEGAMVKAERIRELVEGHPFAHRETQPLGKVTVSLGVSSYPRHAVTPSTLIEIADKALYEAKALGRNKVVGAELLKGRDADASAKSKMTLENVLNAVDQTVETVSVEPAKPVESVQPVELAQPVEPVVEAEALAEPATTAPKVTMKKKLLGPDVNVENLISSLDAALGAGAPGIDDGLKATLFSEDEKSQTEVKRGNSSEG